MTPAPASSPRRRWAALVFKAALTCALGWGLARRISLRGVLDALDGFSWPLWLGGAACLALGTALATWRWRVVLGAMGESQRWADLWRDMLVAVAFNQLLPGAVGGDVARAWRCGRRLSVPSRAWVSILYERLVGLAVLVALPSAALLLNPLPAVGAWVHGVVWACLGGTLLGIGAAPRLVGVGHALARGRWGRVAGWMAQAQEALGGKLGQGAARAEVVAWTLASQVAMLGACWVLSLGWAWEQRAAGVFVGVPLVTALTLLPLGLGGLGWRESAFVVVLGWFGLQEERALALSLGWYALNLALGGVGLGVLGWEQRSPGPPSGPPQGVGAQQEASLR